ncbi:GPI anchored CFEM domain [Fusarium albosuccineum]|uniref:GPI anchored CFEM domain n=1 Tax=Fusarium albosuccineum TaxID=1237068 RepID=A0A8H4KKW6_9HYPO|nr:GPI anchored CFEM domain [Fusarium albosuccineum]
MKAVLLYITALASGLALAQDSAGDVFPKCSQECVLSAIQASGGCAQTDAACVCKSPNFSNNFNTCVNAACDATDAATAISTAYQLCAAAGVTLSSAAGGYPTGAPSNMAPVPPVVSTPPAPVPPPPAPTTAVGPVTPPAPVPPVVQTTAPAATPSGVPTAGAGMLDWSHAALLSAGLSGLTAMMLVLFN